VKGPVDQRKDAPSIT